ncbi:MAG TPA: c-type cytochrome [Acidiferrobacterales bacterium]
MSHRRFAALLSIGLLTAHAATAAPADGAGLYREHCAACHGRDGQGGVGVPLALPAFLDSVDDKFLRETIRRGRPGRVMPAFGRLGAGEIDAIVRHMRGWSSRPAPPRDEARIAGDRARGARLYAAHCAACHGEHGEGGHGTGVTLSRPRRQPILAPGLNNPGFLAAATDTMIKTTLTRGRSGTPMRSFLEQGLRERDIDDVVAFVRGFADAPPPEATRVLETETPVIVRESAYDLDETVEKLKTAVKAANMRLIRVQYLDEGLVPEGKEDKRQVIVYSCDFPFLNEALKIDPRVGLFLPCRVTVVDDGKRVRVMSINPKRLSAIFNNAELNELCERMHQVYVNILEESVF